MAIRFVLKGRVQGVGCRAFVARVARELGLNGFVKNLPGDRVEVVVDGSKEKVSEFKKRIFVRGNPDSDYGMHVEELSEESFDGAVPASFEIRF